MELTKEVREPVAVNPIMMLIYAGPKVGKTTITSFLENHLIAELEPNGASYIKGRVQELNKASEFIQFLELLEAAKEPVCDYLIIDTTTKLDEYSEIVGTYAYMGKSAGKKFNREGNVPTGSVIHYGDEQFETVHSLPNGYGYAHSREVMLKWYDRLLALTTKGTVKHVILIAHTKDKIIEGKNGDSVSTSDISLTGKVRDIYSTRVDAIANFVREQGKGYLNFDNEHKAACGGRCKHLEGKILISEKLEDKSIVTYWDNIYIKDE